MINRFNGPVSGLNGHSSNKGTEVKFPNKLFTVRVPTSYTYNRHNLEGEGIAENPDETTVVMLPLVSIIKIYGDGGSISTPVYKDVSKIYEEINGFIQLVNRSMGIGENFDEEMHDLLVQADRFASEIYDNNSKYLTMSTKVNLLGGFGVGLMNADGNGSNGYITTPSPSGMNGIDITGTRISLVNELDGVTVSNSQILK